LPPWLKKARSQLLNAKRAHEAMRTNIPVAKPFPRVRHNWKEIPAGVRYGADVRSNSLLEREQQARLPEIREANKSVN